jgi:hypothetical protein
MVLQLGYGLNDRGIGVRFHAGARDFSLLYTMQTDSVAHLATLRNGELFPGGRRERGRGVKLTTQLHLLPTPRMV